jgi:type IV secretory pathway VirB10-like protein
MTQPDNEKAIAEGLRLRSTNPPVARLSKGALVVLLSMAALGVAGAVALGLSNRPAKAEATQTYTLGGAPPAGLANLPKDYAAPKLGPPLPGDLGKAIASTTPATPAGNSEGLAASAQQEQQRATQEIDAARTSRLFAGDVHGVALVTERGPADIQDTPLDQGTSGQVAFLKGPIDRRTTSPDRLSSPASPFVLQAGAIIPAALVTGIRSDLPGQIIGQVTENVFDTPSGRYLLIPQGSKLLGAYDSQMSAGQSRVLVTWTRLILPNGRSMVLEKLPGGDAQGYAGLQDGVNHHWGAVAGAAALSTLLGVGVQLGASTTDNSIVSALRFGAASSLNQAGQQIVGRALTIPPTLTIRPGSPVQILVNRDLVLEPYSA